MDPFSEEEMGSESCGPTKSTQGLSVLNGPSNVFWVTVVTHFPQGRGLRGQAREGILLKAESWPSEEAGADKCVEKSSSPEGAPLDIVRQTWPIGRSS